MSIATLSGWGQPHDALEIIAPNGVHIDYASTNNIDCALSLIAKEAAHADTVIGWSMGGQMAVRAIANGLMAPRRLVLIASAYQFLKDSPNAIGMGADTFTQYRANMSQNPTRSFKKSYALIAHRDSRAEQLQPILSNALERLPAHDWLYWLDTLATYRIDSFNLSLLPPTLLLHGENDVVIEPAQSIALKHALPSATLHIVPGCGHAPHWHDPAYVRALIEDHRI